MEFDIVTVGAGPAGCALANRLSADERYSIALVEAGPADLHPWIHVPIGYFRTMNTHDSTGCISRKKMKASRGGPLSGHEDGFSEGQIRSMECFTFVVNHRILTIGRSLDAPGSCWFNSLVSSFCSSSRNWCFGCRPSCQETKP